MFELLKRRRCWTDGVRRSPQALVPGRWVAWAALGGLFVLSTACLGGLSWTLDYQFETEARRIEGVEGVEGVGAEFATMPRSKGDETVTACDENACVAIDVRRGNFQITLSNLDEAPVDLVWSESSFQQQDIGPLPLLPNRERGTMLLPASVPGRSEIVVSVWPKEMGRARLGPGGRSTSPIDGRRLLESTREEIEAVGRSTVGDSFEIRISLRRQGAVSRYILSFVVNGFRPKLISWA